MTFPAPTVHPRQLQPSLLGGTRTAAFVPPGGGAPAPATAAPTGPGGVVSTFTPPPSGGGAMTLQALMARQKEAAARQQANLQQPQGTILGGLGQMTNALFTGLEQNRAAREEATGREALTKLISGYDPSAANAQQVAAQAMQIDPEVGMALISDLIKSRRDAASQERWEPVPTPEGETGQWFRSSVSGETKKVGGGTESSGPKPSDVNSMRGQVLGDESYTSLANQMPIYTSMLKSASQSDRTSDLDLISGLAKMIDPTGVVRGEDVNMIVANQPGMEIYKSYLETWKTDPKARLGPEIRKDIMRLAYDRINGNYNAYETFAKQMRAIAEESGMKGSHVAPVFPQPMPFGAETDKVDPAKAATDDEAYPG
jgi:hypothetical protein